MAYYFASDLHLGLSSPEHSSRDRERLFVAWLDMVREDAEAIFLVGDIFDFWFEYQRVVPKGFVRVLGKLAEIVDSGIEVHFFIGNHDIWTFGYLEQEIGMHVHHTSQTIELGTKRLFIAHGDQYCKVKWSDQLIRKTFHNKTLQWIFSRVLHPDLFMKLGLSWSHDNRYSKSISHDFLGEQESLVRYVRSHIDTSEIDYLVFGHLHVPIIYPLDSGANLVVLGEWIVNPTYGVLRDGVFCLKSFNG